MAAIWCEMLITLSLALQVCPIVSGCHIVVHFTIFLELPLELKGAAPTGLRRMCKHSL